ncbi:hypothetical protein Y032_0957g3211 [Ancylostoma ceylanicum]|uniref:Uncharacterized protein n=1 Tax=Ancylostoma ceylanicum TaxID=53326 RepID=A0A016WA78_9BILA|nr:hypothetical protein Y032_0957g3211 [Ancylostoma ceylanicum]
MREGDQGKYVCRPENSSSPSTMLRIVGIVVIGVAFSVLDAVYLSTVFDRATNFSNMIDFDREMYYVTELGFYFSYYKIIVNAPSFS